MRKVKILPSTAFVDNSSLPNNSALFKKNVFQLYTLHAFHTVGK